MNLVIGWFRHNLWYKLAALALAISLWTYVATRLNPLVTAEVVLPVQVAEVGEEVVVTKPPADSLKVRVRGRQAVVQGLKADPGEAKLVADLTDLGPGENQKVAVEPAGFPAGVRMDWDSGPVVSVTLEPVESREMQVDVLPRGSPPQGFRLVGSSADPSKVTIRGAASDIAAVEKVVAPVGVSSLREAQELRASLQALAADDSPAERVTIIPHEVTVSVAIGPAPRKTVRVVVRYGNPAAGYEVVGVGSEPSEVTVLSRGAQLADLASIPTEVIDLSSATSTVRKTVSLRPPRGVSVEGETTVRATVRIRRRPAPPEEVPPGAEEEPGGGEESSTTGAGEGEGPRPEGEGEEADGGNGGGTSPP